MLEGNGGKVEERLSGLRLLVQFYDSVPRSNSASWANAAAGSLTDFVPRWTRSEKAT